MADNLKNIQDLINDLVALAPIKTWSLIVTLFGDLDGEHLSGKQVRLLLEPLGIKPEATRVALHRLKKDGWVDSQKFGREVTYQLSDFGCRETESVYTDIYSSNIKYPDGWLLSIVREATDVAKSSHMPCIQIGRHIVVTPRINDFDISNAIEIDAVENSIPTWLEERFMSAETLENVKILSSLTRQFIAVKDAASDLEINLMRLLVLHHWRKLALRHATWAHISFLPNASVAKFHTIATDFLSATNPIQVPE